MRIAGLEEGPIKHASLPRPKSRLREASHSRSTPQINKICLSWFHLFLSKSPRKTASRTDWKGCPRGTQKQAQDAGFHTIFLGTLGPQLSGLQGVV